MHRGPQKVLAILPKMIITTLLLLHVTTQAYVLPSPSDHNNPDPFNRNTNLRNDYLKPIVNLQKYKSASDVLQSISMDEDIVSMREEYTFLPGIMQLGTGLDMLSNTQTTQILHFHPTSFHSMEEGEELHRHCRF